MMVSTSALIISSYLLQVFAAFLETHQNLVWVELEESAGNKSQLKTIYYTFSTQSALVNFTIRSSQVKYNFPSVRIGKCHEAVSFLGGLGACTPKILKN